MIKLFIILLFSISRVRTASKSFDCTSKRAVTSARNSLPFYKRGQFNVLFGIPTRMNLCITLAKGYRILLGRESGSRFVGAWRTLGRRLCFLFYLLLLLHHFFGTGFYFGCPSLLDLFFFFSGLVPMVGSPGSAVPVPRHNRFSLQLNFLAIKKKCRDVQVPLNEVGCFERPHGERQMWRKGKPWEICFGQLNSLPTQLNSIRWQVEENQWTCEFSFIVKKILS